MTKWAAYEGNIECLEYLLDLNCPVVDAVHYACQPAAGNRSALDCVRYIVEEQGMYMDENGEVFAVAFGNADIELMEYLLDNGCPYQNYSDTAPFFLLLYLEIQRDDTEDDAECFFDFEVRLIECIELAHTHGYNFTDDLLHFICENFPLCQSYLAMEGYIEPGMHNVVVENTGYDSTTEL
eukprot:gene8029-9568_t